MKYNIVILLMSLKRKQKKCIYFLKDAEIINFIFTFGENLEIFLYILLIYYFSLLY